MKDTNNTNMEFPEYLHEIKKLLKNGKNDEAWRLCNMSRIRYKEKAYKHALTLMGVVISGLGGFGGITHEKYTKQLLKRLGKEGKVREYLSLCHGNAGDVMRSIKNGY